MADLSTCAPLTPESIRTAHKSIAKYIHRTPLLTSRTLNKIASQPQLPSGISINVSLFFKCENQQRIGAFKARGAHHALLRLIDTVGIDEVIRRGVVTHSSGNHGQALALAASTFSITAYIVMPTISTPSKISGTRDYTDHIIFSGSTSKEREDKVDEVIQETGAILVPPYDHPDIILGQGTAGYETQEQYQEIFSSNPQCSTHPSRAHLDALISPCGGGGLLSGLATNFTSNNKSKTLVFGAEPSFSGADDAVRGLSSNPPKRIDHVSSLTIADGLRTPLGDITWSVISDKTKVQGVYSVSEDEIKKAMKFILERLKVWVEPSAAVGFAVILFCEEWRKLVPPEGWDVAVILTGGNTTVEAVADLFQDHTLGRPSRETARIGINGEQKAENVAG